MKPEQGEKRWNDMPQHERFSRIRSLHPMAYFRPFKELTDDEKMKVRKFLGETSE